MGTSMTPGPPLTAGDEFCECEPPSRWEYCRAIAAALGAALLAAGLQVGVAFVSGRAWGVAAACAGLLVGYLVHLAAGRHRSRTVGILSAAGALLAAGANYGALMLLFADRGLLVHTSGWFYLALTIVGAFVAFYMAGPTGKEEPL